MTSTIGRLGQSSANDQSEVLGAHVGELDLPSALAPERGEAGRSEIKGADVMEAAKAWQDEHARLRLFEFTVEHANDPVLITTTDLDKPGPSIVYVNRAFQRISGYSPEEVIGRTPRILQGPETSRVEMARLRSELEAGRPFVGETVNYAKDGRAYYMEWSVYGLRDEAGIVRYYVAVQRDISERKKYEIQIEEQARDLAAANEQLAEANRRLAELSLTDNLTGIFNHRALEQKMREELARARRYGFPLSLLLMDVDRFKKYNDTFGHPEGDAALQQIAQILRSHSRPSDVVARHGGEEFAVLLPQTDHAGALILAEQHRVAIESAVWPRRAVTVSIGVATLKGSDLDDDESALMCRADEALYRSKSEGRNRVS